MVDLVERTNWVDGRRERERSMERTVMWRWEDCFPGHVAFIYNGVSAFRRGWTGHSQVSSTERQKFLELQHVSVLYYSRLATGIVHSYFLCVGSLFSIVCQLVPTLASHRYLFHTGGGILRILGMKSVDLWDLYDTQLYIVAEIILCSSSMEHEEVLFTQPGSSLRLKRAE